MATDQFCLRWNNFQSNIVTALDSLKNEEDLVDVTLVCEAHAVKAHKVILSACSPYFRNVFRENPCQHPVVILKDVSAEDVEALLSFMYQGEVYISQERLSSFLRTAELLQVRGLTGASAPTSSLHSELVKLQPHQTSPITHHQSSVPGLRPSSHHRGSNKTPRSAGSPPPLSVLPQSAPHSASSASSKPRTEGSPQPKRRKAIPRRVPAPPVNPEEPLGVVTKQEPLDEDEMFHDEEAKTGGSGDEDMDDGESSRLHGMSTSASQSPLASDESTSMLARSLTAPRNNDAPGSHSPLQNSLFGIELSSSEQLSPDDKRCMEKRMSSRPCPVCHKVISNKSNLIKHMRIRHGGSYLREVSCHLCGKIFKHKYSLSAHIYSIHRQVNPADIPPDQEYVGEPFTP